MQDENEDGEASAAPMIVATRVAEGRRYDFLYRQLATDFIRFESLAFMHLGNASEDYHGGTWDFYTLSNGGFYMAPSAPESFRLCCPGNGYEGTVSADAAGIFACSMALSHLSFTASTERPAHRFYLLRAFYKRHAEASALLRALD
jgi:hypothetical protein